MVKVASESKLFSEAVEALGKIGEPATDALISLWQDVDSTHVERPFHQQYFVSELNEIACALVKCASDKTTQLFIDSLEDEAASVKAIALLALATLKDKSAISAVTKLLDEHEMVMRIHLVSLAPSFRKRHDDKVSLSEIAKFTIDEIEKVYSVNQGSNQQRVLE